MAISLCRECGEAEPAGAPMCSSCAAYLDAMVEQGWKSYLLREFGDVDEEQERAIAEMVVQEPQRHEWRVYDGACDCLECPECGSPLGRGPVGCHPCDMADGNRYAAIEIDRPGVPPGNEHAIRVNVAVLRRCWVSWQRVGPNRCAPGPTHAKSTAAPEQSYNRVSWQRVGPDRCAPGPTHAKSTAAPEQSHNLSPAELFGRRMVLPMLMAGGLPTTAEAQRMAKKLKKMNNSMDGE